MKRNLTVIFITLVVTGVGFLVGGFIGRVVLGTVAGLVIGLPLGLALITRRRRWAATAVLNVWFVLSYVAGGWLGVGYSLAASILTFIVSAAIVRELYGGSTFSALFSHFKILTGLLKGFQIIDNGRSIVPAETGIVMGPRLIVVRPGNAVILERGPRQTRISGPAIFTTNLFEYVRRIYNLQERQEKLTFRDVLTNDLMTTMVEVLVNYTINISDDSRRGEIALTSQEIEYLRRIDARMPDWEQTIKGMIEASIRRAIASCELMQLIGGNLPGLEQQIWRELNNSRDQVQGVRVDDITVLSIQPDHGVIAERARAVVWREALELLADGYRNATTAGVPEGVMHQEALRHTLDQIAKDPATKLIFTSDDHQALADLRMATGLEQ